MAGVYAARPFSGAALALGQRGQRVANAPVDLDALAREARALAVGALARDADLGDIVLPRRRLDRGDLRRQRAPVVLERHEQVGLERDDEIAGARLGGDAETEHAECMHRERQRVALVAAERQERAAPGRRGVGGGTPAL